MSGEECDDLASLHVGSGLIVAEAIVAVERVLETTLAPRSVRACVRHASRDGDVPPEIDDAPKLE